MSVCNCSTSGTVDQLWVGVTDSMRNGPTCIGICMAPCCLLTVKDTVSRQAGHTPLFAVVEEEGEGFALVRDWASVAPHFRPQAAPTVGKTVLSIVCPSTVAPTSRCDCNPAAYVTTYVPTCVVPPPTSVPTNRRYLQTYPRVDGSTHAASTH